MSATAQTAWDTSGPSMIADALRSQPRTYAGKPHHIDKPRGSSARLKSADHNPNGRPAIHIDLQELLDYYQGRTYAQCAAHFGCSTFTIGKRLRAAGRAVGKGNYDRSCFFYDQGDKDREALRG